MQAEEARGFVFQALRSGGWDQWVTLLNTVAIVKARAMNISINQVQAQYGTQVLTDHEKTLIMEVVWSLIIQGILIPGLNDSNQGGPFLRLTEYGRRCIQEDRMLPHDPDGFLRDC